MSNIVNSSADDSPEAVVRDEKSVPGLSPSESAPTSASAGTFSLRRDTYFNETSAGVHDAGGARVQENRSASK